MLPTDIQRAAEVERICTGTAFVRAPVMRKLLQFLVGETSAGRGDGLKAYGVAVDGLGRSPDFDSQADSYPRVQVGRLRRMLAQFYAEQGPGVEGIGLTIPNGSYRVHWAFLDAEENVAPPSPDPVEPPPFLDPARSKARLGIMVTLVLALVAGAGFWLVNRSGKTTLVAHAAGVGTRDVGMPPVLELSPIVPAEGADPALARSVDRVLGDALHRTWVFNVGDGRKADNGKQGEASDYRLAGTLVGNDPKTLYLELWNQRDGTQIWSQRRALSNEASLGEALGPAINAIMSPLGAIGSRERRELAGDFTPGFPCMLRYVEFYMGQSAVAPVHKCLRQTVQNDPGYGPALAAQIVMRLRHATLDPRNAPVARRGTLALARQAVDADPYSADAAMAMAMAAYANGMCDLGRTSAMQGMERNPFDSYSYARTGMYMFQCGDEEYETMLRRAWALDSALPALIAMPIMVAMSDRGEGEAALHLARTLPLAGGYRRSGYELTMAVAHAAAGDNSAAHDHWRAAASAVRLPGDAAPEEVLERILWSPQMAERTEGFLRRRGLFG